MSGNRACLSGKEVSELLEGKMVAAYGVEFVYDGSEIQRVVQSVETLKKNESFEKSAKVTSKK